jgi:hypothetical protein
MAKQDFPSNVDRRCLLISTAAFAAYSIAPGVECAEVASPATEAQPLSGAPGVQSLDVCAATARRLLEIEGRNEIRRKAQLPLLSIPRELRRMKVQEMSEEFGRFAAAHNKAVWEQLSKRHRDASGNPNRRPNSLEGMCLQNKVREILWERFSLARRSA